MIPGLGRLGQKDHGLDVDSGYTVSLPWEVKEVTYKLHNQDTRFGFRFLGLCFVLAFFVVWRHSSTLKTKSTSAKQMLSS